MSRHYIPPESRALALPFISNEAYETVDTAWIKTGGSLYDMLYAEIGHKRQQVAICVGMECAEAYLICRDITYDDNDVLAMQRQVVLTYGGLMRQQERDEAAAAAFGFGIPAGGVPLLPNRTAGTLESDVVCRIADYFRADENGIIRETHRKIDERRDGLHLFVDGSIYRPEDGNVGMAARVGCIGMVGIIDAYSFYQSKAV